MKDHGNVATVKERYNRAVKAFDEIPEDEPRHRCMAAGILLGWVMPWPELASTMKSGMGSRT